MITSMTINQKEEIMKSINPIRLGWAFGVTFTLMYLGCVIVMMMVGHDGTVLLFNSLLHGVDVSTVIRMDMPFWEMCMGLCLTFLIAWFAGATVGSVYNYVGKWIRD